MTHQIPPHLAFCTPRQNQKAKQGTNPETLNRVLQFQFLLFMCTVHVAIKFIFCFNLQIRFLPQSAISFSAD